MFCYPSWSGHDGKLLPVDGGLLKISAIKAFNFNDMDLFLVTHRLLNIQSVWHYSLLTISVIQYLSLLWCESTRHLHLHIKGGKNMWKLTRMNEKTTADNFFEVVFAFELLNCCWWWNRFGNWLKSLSKIHHSFERGKKRSYEL